MRNLRPLQMRFLASPTNRGFANPFPTWMVLVLAVFTVCAVTTSVLFPIFEAPDEPSHFLYARRIANGHLPVQTDPERTAHAEGFNPPLYYILVAPVLIAFDPERGAAIDIRTSLPEQYALATAKARRTGDLRPDTGLVPPQNPLFFWWGIGNAPNWFAHPPEGPWATGPLRAVHAMRLVSVCCGILTVIGVFLIARTCLPDNPAAQLVAVSVVAFNPQFVYLSGVLNSDNLVTTVATFTLWRLSVTAQGGTATDGHAAFVGLLLGAGILAKTNMLFMALPAMVVFWRVRTTRAGFLRQVAIMTCVSALLAGWFFLRNALLYGNGDFLGWEARLRLEPIFALPKGFRWAYFTERFFPTLFYSYWGRFGWLSLSLPNWQYAFYGLISMLPLVSLKVLDGNRGPAARNATLLCLGSTGLNLIALVTFNLRFTANQGRLLFPTIAGVAIAAAIGWSILCSAHSHRFRWGVAVGLSTAMVALVIYAQWGIVFPVYF